jgi:hypothetical protein
MSLSWKRLIGFLLIAVAACGVMFAAWVGFVFYMYNMVTTHDEFWVEAIVARKKAAAEKRQGGRLIIVAGSTGWYGFRVATMEEKLGVPVANMAIHAGLSIAGVCSDALAVARPGDAILMGFEYEQFERDPFQYRSMGHMLRVHPDMLPALPPLEALRYVLAPPLSEFQFRWEYLQRIRRGEDVYSFGREVVSLTDDEGEITDRNEKYGKPVDPYAQPKILEPIHPKAIERLSYYIKRFQKMGLPVFATWPPRLLHPDYDREQVAAFQKQMREFYEAHGVVVLGEPTISVEQGDRFFDHSGHLTAKAAKERSRIVSDWLLANPVFEKWLKTRPQ